MTSYTRMKLLKGMVTTAILALLMLSLDLQKSWDLLRNVDLLPVLMAVGLLAVSHMVVALIWRRLLDEIGIGIGVERAVRLYFAGLFLNNFFLGSVGGDTYRVYGVYKGSGTGRVALAGTVLERLISVIALLLLGVIAILARFGELPVTFRWSLLLATGGGALAGLSVIFIPRLVGKISDPLTRRASQKLRDRVKGLLEAMDRGGRPLLVLPMLLVAFAAQAVRIWTHWWCAQALGLDVMAGDLFIVIPLVAVAAGLPISIGGLGVREGSGVLLLAPLGMAEPSIVAMEFLAYLVGVGTSLIGGLAFLLGREIPPSAVKPINEEGNSTVKLQ